MSNPAAEWGGPFGVAARYYHEDVWQAFDQDAGDLYIQKFALTSQTWIRAVGESLK